MLRPKLEVFKKFGSKIALFRKIFLTKIFKIFCRFLSHHKHMYLYPSQRYMFLASKSHVSKNGHVQKKFNGKNFKFDIFVTRNVLNYSKSIPMKIFFEKFSIFWSFVAKSHFLIFRVKIFETFFTRLIRIVLRSFYAIAHFPMYIELCRLTRISNFRPKMARNRGFSKILGRKNFFRKNFF